MIKNEIIRLLAGEVGENNAKVGAHPLQFTRVSVGDANGILPPLDTSRTALDNHVTDGEIVSHKVDKEDPTQRILQLRVGPDANYDARELLVYASANGVEFPHSYIRLGSPYPVRDSSNGGAQILIDVTIRISSEAEFSINVSPGTDFISRPEFESHNHDDLYAKLTDITNSLTSTATNKALSANQGRVLKGYIDNINNLLSSNDVSLDELQEIVDFIKINKSTLDSLNISSIAGLQNALDNKVDSSRVLTPVPANAVFTDTQHPLSSSFTSSDNTVAATSRAVKYAYNRGTAGIEAASAVQNNLDTRLPKKRIQVYYTDGDVDINFETAHIHIVIRWGIGYGTITCSGSLQQGDKFIVLNVRTDCGTATIEGPRMYTGRGGESAYSHTLTGGAKVVFRAYVNGTSLMRESVEKWS